MSSQEQLLARDILALPPGLIFVGALGTPEQCHETHVKFADALIACAGDNAYVPFETDAFVLSSVAPRSSRHQGDTPPLAQSCYQGKTCQRAGCGLQFCPAAGIMASQWPPPPHRGTSIPLPPAERAPRVVHVIPSSSNSKSPAFVPKIVEYLRRVRWPDATFVIEIRGARGIHATLEPLSREKEEEEHAAIAAAARAVFLRKNAVALFRHLIDISPSYLLRRSGKYAAENCISSSLIPCPVFTDCLVRDDVLRDLATLMTFAPSLTLCDAVRAFFCPLPSIVPPIPPHRSPLTKEQEEGDSLTALEQSIWEMAAEVKEGNAAAAASSSVPLDPDTEEFLAELSSFVPPHHPEGEEATQIPPPPQPSSKFIADAPSVLLCGPPGGGKCLHPDTPVRAADGSVLLARNVTVGTWLAGPRKTPRRVTAVLPAGREFGQLWVIHRSSVLNDGPYVTNSDHVLVLREITSSSSSGTLVKIRASAFAALPPAVAARYRDVASRFVLPGAPSAAEISSVLAGAIAYAVDAGRVRWETVYFSLPPSPSSSCAREGGTEEEALFYFWPQQREEEEGDSFSPSLPLGTLVNYARSIGLRAAVANSAVVLGSGEDMALFTFLSVFLPSGSAARAVTWCPDSAHRRSPGSPIHISPADPAVYGNTYAGFELDVGPGEDGTFLLADGTVTHNTSLIRRFAADAGLPLLTITPATIFAKYVGESESRAAAVMSLALKRAPVVLFFDELDGILGTRYNATGGGGETAGDPIARNVKNLILAGWDAINRQGGKGTVCLFGATNHPERIDPAVLDRFSERVRVGLPGPVARKNLFAAFLDDEPCCCSSPVDSEALAAAATGLSAREIRAICARAVRSFFASSSAGKKRKRQDGGERPPLSPFLTTADVLAAFAPSSSSSAAAAGERNTRAIGGDEGNGGRDTAAASLFMYC